MKAKEYAERIAASITDHNTLPPEEAVDFLIEAIHSVGTDMIAEMKELAETRKARSDAAVASIIREQYMKWRAMCRELAKMVNEEVLDPEGFKTIIKSAFPPQVYRYMDKMGWK